MSVIRGMGCAKQIRNVQWVDPCHIAILVKASKVLLDDLLQQFATGPKVNVLADANDRATDKARFHQHKIHEIVVSQCAFLRSDFLEAWTSKIEHLEGGSSLEQIFDFRTAEWMLEKIAVVDVNFIMREELPRLTASASRCPAVKIYFHMNSPLIFCLAGRDPYAFLFDTTFPEWLCQVSYPNCHPQMLLIFN